MRRIARRAPRGLGASRLALGAALLILLGCAGDPAAGPEVDRDIETTLHRVVVMAPAAAETVAALGLEESVVAVGDFVRWPPEVADRPKVGAYDRPNLERILALRADLYVTARSQAAASAHRRLEALGVEVLALETATYGGTLAAIGELGAALGHGAAARALVAGIEARVEAVERRAAGLPRRRVLVAVGREPLFAAGPGSHLGRLIDAAGGENAAGDAASTYPMLSFEAALERLPEVIVDTSDNRAGALRGRAPGWWSNWPFLPAVREDRVYHVDPSRLAIPGPRLGEMAELVARLIHPETFGEPAPEDYEALSGAFARAIGARGAAPTAGRAEAR